MFTGATRRGANATVNAKPLVQATRKEGDEEKVGGQPQQKNKEERGRRGRKRERAGGVSSGKEIII